MYVSQLLIIAVGTLFSKFKVKNGIDAQIFTYQNHQEYFFSFSHFPMGRYWVDNRLY